MGIEAKRFKLTWDSGRRLKLTWYSCRWSKPGISVEGVNLPWDSGMESKPQRGLRQRILKLQGIQINVD